MTATLNDLRAVVLDYQVVVELLLWGDARLPYDQAASPFWLAAVGDGSWKLRVMSCEPVANS